MIERIEEHKRRTKLVRSVDMLTAELERLGATDMGLLQRRFASRFHTVTDLLRKLTLELKQEV